MRSLIGCCRLVKLGWFVVCCLAIVFCVLSHVGPEKKGRIIRTWSGKLPRWLGIPVYLKGDVGCPEALDTGVTPGAMGRLFVSNHMTFIDPVVIDSVLPSGFVAKAEIAKWPLLGTITSAVGTIYIERGNKRALLGISDNMQDALKEGRSVLMFPEGTTSSGEGILPLHANLFEAAAKTGAPVIPLVIRYQIDGKDTTLASWVNNESLMTCLWRIVCAKNLSVTVNVLKPLTGTNRHALCEETSRAMSEFLGIEDPLAKKA